MLRKNFCSLLMAATGGLCLLLTACVLPTGPGIEELTDKPAPPATLQTLAGETTTLANLKGKVVVLDFWATWCPPCRKSLPVFQDVAQSYADNNQVVFYAVNQQESRDEIQAFLDSAKLQLPVALDENGSIGDAFGVRAIPSTVVVGPDGVVKLAEEGFSGNYGDMLRETIEGLLQP